MSTPSELTTDELYLFRNRMQEYRARFDAAMAKISKLPDALEVDATILVAMLRAVLGLEAFANLSRAEHITRVAASLTQHVQQLDNHRITVTNAQWNRNRNWQPGEQEARQRVEAQRADAEMAIPVLHRRICRMQEVLEVLNPIPESSNEK